VGAVSSSVAGGPAALVEVATGLCAVSFFALCPLLLFSVLFMMLMLMLTVCCCLLLSKELKQRT
jgi:hypothetical protein